MKNIFSTLGSFLIGGLILLGIGGMAYHLFRDEGLISQGLGALWKAQYQAPLMTIILIIAGILYSGRFIPHRSVANAKARFLILSCLLLSPPVFSFSAA